MSFPEGEGFPSSNIRLSSEEAMIAMVRAGRETARRKAWEAEKDHLEAMVKSGLRTVKPGHRVMGIEGTGRHQEKEIEVPLTAGQLKRRQAKIGILSGKLGHA